jgi:acetyl-CoA synthetase
MHDNLYAVPASFAASAQIKAGDYERMYVESLEDPERFWGCIGHRLDWIKEYSRVKDSSYSADDCHIRWFDDGKLNVASNCLDRNHLGG